MYEQAQTKVAELRQTELSAIHSELIDVNEKCHKLIMEITESLNKIQPYSEPNKMESVPSKPEEPSLVNDLKRQLRFARENSDRLVNITRHLNTLI
jgi:hypothetical protein